MTITSNIQGVLDRVRRKPRDVRAALTRTLAPGEWDKLLRAEAKKTLWALAKQSEWSFVDAFMNTLLTGPFITGFMARMNNPMPPVLDMMDFAMARGLMMGAFRRGDRPTAENMNDPITMGGDGNARPQMNLFSDFVNQFDQMVIDWVANEKKKDQRDWDKTDEDIGHWISYLMLTPDNKLSDKRSGRVNPVTGKEAMSELEAKQSLMKHIAEYIERRQTQKRLGSETINAWLKAVLAVWSALVRREFPGKFREQLKIVRSEL